MYTLQTRSPLDIADWLLRQNHAENEDEEKAGMSFTIDTINAMAEKMTYTYRNLKITSFKVEHPTETKSRKNQTLLNI